ncbi:MAG: hypothetical protein RH917_16915 [Lacipirellulaceae bacterium]
MNVPSFTVVKQYEPKVGEERLGSAIDLADQILKERPSLRLTSEFQALVPERISPAPTLHLDDLSEIRRLKSLSNACYFQERARLRASEDDMVAVCGPETAAYEDYCREQLGLGSVRWLHPKPRARLDQLAGACWEDDVVRTELICRVLSDELVYLHPHMGCLPVWELASLLSHESGRSIQVIAPPPQLTAWVNNKLEFATIVQKLLGERYVPRTVSAGCYATLADRVMEITSSCKTIGIKVTNSAGGKGIAILDGASLHNQTLSGLRTHLQSELESFQWDGQSELIINCWETAIACSPSAQLWIPPPQQGGPIIEGIFMQAMSDRLTDFKGSEAAVLPEPQMQEIVDKSYLISLLFQRLGYMGRCSFDLLLVGDGLEDSRVEFIECNGRWGGTSAPMTLMNRLFDDWKEQPYISRIVTVNHLSSVGFSELKDSLTDILYSQSAKNGRVIIILPGRVAFCSEIELIILGSTTIEAKEFLDGVILPRLHRLVDDYDLASGIH